MKRCNEREFATAVVERLREAGFTAFWAGGCVRDLLMGNEPSDYDVATSATPLQVRELFGRRRTLAVGMSFGVVIVLNERQPGEQVEVATFRTDAAYSDGRHPDAVEFSTPQEDAQRRDFTINGMFFDPLTESVIDYVGGVEDLQRRTVRAIGCADNRIAEDKLRMLRAVRFAARFDFAIESQTRQAILRHAAEVTCVSGERQWTEITKSLETPRPAWVVQEWYDLHLLPHILPELDANWNARCTTAGRLLAALVSPSQTSTSTPALQIKNELSVRADWLDRLCALLWNALRGEGIHDATPETEVCPAHITVDGMVQSLKQRLKQSNETSEAIRFCLVTQSMLADAERKKWSQVQPLLINSHIRRAIHLLEARASLAGPERERMMLDTVHWLEEQLALPAEELNPRPLLLGHDLIAMGMKPSPSFRELLSTARQMQLDRQLLDRPAALTWLSLQGGQ